jgi:ribosome-binding factor A
LGKLIDCVIGRLSDLKNGDWKLETGGGFDFLVSNFQFPISVFRTNDSITQSLNRPITQFLTMAPPEWRTARLAEQIRGEVEEIVTGELKDPRVGFVTITQVVLSPDLHHARILVTVPGGDEERQETIEGLSSAAGFVSHEVGRRLQLRRSPEIVFVPDRGAEAELKVEALLQQLKSSGE